MKVELIETAGGDLSIVNSARVSFDKESELVVAVGEKPRLSERDAKLIKYLAKHKHMTPFRHNFIQLRCSVPLFLARQLMKHQAGLTWNEVSRRYVDDVPEFYYPKGWRKRPEDGIKQGSSSEFYTGQIEIFDYYEDLSSVECKYSAGIDHAYSDVVSFCREVYQAMVQSGVAPEMARMVLPQSMMVDFIWSGNLLAFSHVYNLRSGEGAQVEAREFAELLSKAIEPEFPVGWRALCGDSGVKP